ncbi:2-oxo-4-hydroxy-4-carboxy-5-ureidoimidazoline decarboxylase [Pectobacterium sp. CFBP8739]|uniref:2-oxo-4-hydroxy-4-carboxy-5-ureidoimidazoline decarboxylase n=1 Tax=unclassified Pectobacterium TaxID=2627739 RepID=UPI0015DDAF90|nr:2-oxo-4-hydroxy-4-carboxy-5-ureidoimidazoline decarboxylase [Pectobacterium sp. CFBP8739]MBA0168894.1 2-oxo-4-hydroxy-4-carboxy-5-ureidoimidazoline decarboxylase [Pectobacterium sp. CFBP8739]
MASLEQFNQLNEKEAQALLLPCVALPRWVKLVAQGRPYLHVSDVLEAGMQASQDWQAEDLRLALSTHPRIGEKAAGSTQEAELSRQEQAAVNHDDAALAQALREGNVRYEAQFGHVFLVRAKGRSAEDILHLLQQRLQNTPEQETREALIQLREITMLRLEGVFNE